MTTTLPADWDITDASTWGFETTVDAHRGYHLDSQGNIDGTYRELETITTYAQDSGWFDNGNDVDQDAAEWWYDVLEPYHRALVMIAESSPEEFEAAAKSLDAKEHADGQYDIWSGLNTDDLEWQAISAGKIIAALEASKATA